MHVLSCVMPKFVRQGTTYKFLKIEQKAENLHCVFNNIERHFLYQKNKAKRYFLMLKEYENMLKKIILCLKRRLEKDRVNKYVINKLFYKIHPIISFS